MRITVSLISLEKKVFTNMQGTEQKEVCTVKGYEVRKRVGQSQCWFLGAS